MRRALTELERRTSVLSLGYCRSFGETIDAAKSNLLKVSEEIRLRWAGKPGRYPIIIENELDGAACAGGTK